MAYQDLRQFLEVLEKEGELLRISQPVDVRYELSAICRQALDTGGLERNKALLFERPGGPDKGQDIPLVASLLATRRRYALALETEVEDIHRKFIGAASAPVPPVLVEEGPCQEEVITGEEVDLFRFPIPTWYELDPGPFITAPCHISRDPKTGRRNMGVYRAQVHDRNHLGLLASPYRHIAIQCRKAHLAGQPFPVVIALGPDPSVWVAAQTSLPLGEDELALAGALRGQPLELVKCKTVDLAVPATSEIVLEGEVLPQELKEEGPFGEFTGYYGAERALRPVLTIKAITHRRHPIYHAACQGRPPNETSITSLIPYEVEIMRNVRLPGLRTVHLSQGGVSFVAVAALRKLYEGYGKVMATAILSTEPGRMVKTLILVDEDINPSDRNLVDWALATRFQPAQDAIILEGFPGVALDPTMPLAERAAERYRTSKIILDATRPWGPDFPPEARPPEEVMQRVIQSWNSYGINERQEKFAKEGTTPGRVDRAAGAAPAPYPEE